MGLGVLGYFIATFAYDYPGVIPTQLEKVWGRGFVASLLLGCLFYLGIMGAAEMGNLIPLNSFKNLIVQSFPHEQSAFRAGVILFSPVIIPPLLWGLTGFGMLPFCIVFLIQKIRNRSYRGFL